MGSICVYSGDSLKTRDKIMGDVSMYTVNKLYKNTEHNIYWFINQRGYMHVLKPSRTSLNGKTIGYSVVDYMVTKDNMLKYMGVIFRYNTVDEVINKLEDLLNETDVL